MGRHETLERLPPDPNVSATASLQRDLSSVMANEDLSEAEKSQLYGQTLHKFKTAHQKALKETSLFPQSDPSSSKMNQLVIDSVPSTMKRKAQLLVSLLKTNPNVSWEDDGTVKLYGKSIPGSNIIDLVNDVIRHRKGSEPTGWQAFAEGLRDMNIKNEPQVSENLYGKSNSKKVKPKFKVNDFVRINKTKRTFDKGFLPNWTQELFQILAVVKTQTPITYKIKDLEGELVKGTFYSHKLQRVENDQIYEIDSVLDHRKHKVGKKWVKEIKVHWKGYPSKFDSWILESDLV